MQDERAEIMYKRCQMRGPLESFWSLMTDPVRIDRAPVIISSLVNYLMVTYQAYSLSKHAAMT